MTIAMLEEIGGPVLVTGAVALWVAVLLRAPGARRSVPQRRLLIAVAGLALSITVYLDPVTAVLHRTPLASSCGIAMNVWGVLSAAFILDFVLAALSSRRPRLVYGAAIAVSAVLVALNAADRGAQAGCVTSVDVPWYSPFWWLLAGAHIVAVVPSAVVCLRYARRAGTRSLRVGLALLAAGFASSTFFWSVLVLGQLVTGSPWTAALFALNIGFTAWLMTASTALPLLVGVHRAGRNLRVLSRLRPLRAVLVDAVPQVRIPQPTVGGIGWWSVDLRLYWRVIEIRDALLILRHHVGEPTVEAARAHVRAVAPGGDQEAAVTACWLAVALDDETRGAPPPAAAAPAPPPTGGNAWTGEIRFQQALVRARRSVLAHDFVHGRAAAVPATPGGLR